MTTPLAYSIGYRGLPPSTVWRDLHAYNVEVLVDVRPSPRRALLWGSSTLRRACAWRGVTYLPLVRCADLRALAGSHRVALISSAPTHIGSRRDRVASQYGLRVWALNPRPSQPPLFAEAS